jgi:hypothetical protein
VWERLSQECAKDDDVERRDVGPDGAVLSSSAQDLFNGGVHLGPETDGVLVEGYRAAVHGQHELGTVFNGLVYKATEGVDPRISAGNSALGRVENKPERPECERCQKVLARRIAPVESGDTYSGVRGDGGNGYAGSFSPDCCRRGGQYAVAIRCSVASKLTSPGAGCLCVPTALAHMADDGTS